MPTTVSRRDLRLDFFRGLALWFIFIDHVPSTVIGNLTFRNFGFSDATEIFVFISGYTARVAGTEMGVTEPAATFSACFGAPFLVWHPAKYAELLAEKMKQHKVNVWLINTGWSGGSHGVGARIKLKYTRAIIDAIHAGTLASAPTHPDPIFGLHVVTQVPHVPAGILIPENTWADKETFAATAHKLASLFIANFKKFESGVTPQVKAAGPKA